jgi:hypothetical protein
MSKCWYNLDIDVYNALNPSFKWPVHSPNQQHLECWGYHPTEILNSNWINYTRSLGLEWGFIHIFWKRSYLVHDSAHLDVHTGDESKSWPFALNWTIQDSDKSTMLWYELPEVNYSVKYSSANTPYAEWKTVNLKEMDRHHVGNNMTLVRTNVPHEVNTGPSDRWCISARLKDSLNVSWDQAVEFFKSKNLLKDSTT